MNPSPTPQIVIYASKEKGLGPVGNRPDEGPQMPVAKYLLVGGLRLRLSRANPRVVKIRILVFHPPLACPAGDFF